MSSHHSLCRSVGSGIPFNLGVGPDAVTVLLQPMRLVDWGVLEQLLLYQRKNNIDFYRMDRDTYDMLSGSLKEDRSIPINELIDFASTREGGSWRLWLSLRQKYSYSQCAEWIDILVHTERLGEYLNAALQIDGLDMFAEMDWPIMPYEFELNQIRGNPSQNKYVDWKVFTNSVAEAFKIAPTIFGELTYYQARLMLWDRDKLAGKFTITQDEQKNLSEILRMRKLYEQQQAVQQNAFSP